jgi:uncharacterized protein YfaS (alpha-2-macroglobulin family)
LGVDSGQRVVHKYDGSSSGEPFLGDSYEAYIVLARDLYKPGESFSAKVLVRDAKMLPPKGPFPLLYRLADPDSRVMAQGRVTLAADGGADFTVDIPFSGRVGGWTLEVRLPEADGPLGTALVSVEDFVPPRLALELAAPDKVVGTGVTAQLNGSARYLFGAPGGGLEWEMAARASGENFSPRGHEGFMFGVDPNLADHSPRMGDKAGALDEGGRLDYSLLLSGDPGELPARVGLHFSWKVREDGGRWNGKESFVPWFPRETILGLKPAGPLVAGEESSFELVAVDTEGRPAQSGEVALKVFRVVPGRYGLVRHGQIRSQSVDRLEGLREMTLKLAGGKATFALGPLESGLYEFVARGASGETLRRRLSVGITSRTEPLSPFGAAGTLTLGLDKDSYRQGETARISVKGPFDGPVWLTLETDKLLWSWVGRMKGGALETVLTVPAGIVQNAHLNAEAVKPLKAGERGFLAMGRLSLPMDLTPHGLKVQAETEGRLSPSSKAKVTIRLTDQAGHPLGGTASLALVDEGILSLTSFSVPDPLSFFGRGRKAAGALYDLYHQLLPPEKRALPFLTPGGGAGGDFRDSLFSPFKRDQIPLSLFLARVEIPESGRVEVELDLPEYSGSARLSVVAESRDRFGTFQSFVKIGRDLTVEPTLPLALAPGDQFVATVRLALAESAEKADSVEKGQAGQALISPSVEGPLTIVKVTDREGGALPLPYAPKLAPGQAETILVHLKAGPSRAIGDPPVGLADGGGRPEAVGPAALALAVSGAGEDFSQRATTVVRPPFAAVSRSQGAQLSQAKTELKLDPGGFLPGTVTSTFALAAGPAVEAAQAAVFLQNYPYGCLEQTVSQGWAHLAALDMGTFVAENGELEARLALDGAVKRVATMKTFQGGFGSWPNESKPWIWGSVYAVHFLVEAQRLIDLPDGLLDDGLAYLKALLDRPMGQNPAETLSHKAYALLVLSLNGDYRQASLNFLSERRDGLSKAAAIRLAGAEALTVGRPGALEELMAKVLPAEKPTDHYSLESRAANEALLLYAWTAVDPLNPKTADLAARVAESGRRRDWRTTQENGLAVLALSSFMLKTGGSEPYRAIVTDPSSGRVLAQGGELDSLSLGPQALGDLPEDKISVSLSGKGRPWYSLTVRGVPLEPPRPEASGLTLAKRWEVKAGPSLDLGSPNESAPAIAVRRGQLVRVELTVSAEKKTDNVVVVDLLPGGFEIEGLAIPGGRDGQGEGSDPDGPNRDYGDGDYGHGDDDYDGDGRRGNPVDSAHLELREDRVVCVIPELEGTATLSYDLRAVTAGDFIVPPATAEGMYHPERKAVLAASRVTVSPGD